MAQLEKLWTLARACIIAVVFVSLQTWFLPHWFRLRGATDAPLLEPLRLFGAVPLVLGAVVMASCVWNFGHTGRGTPAPFDPPRQLVTRGPYVYVRNPMYVGMALALLGEAILFAQPTLRLLVYGAVLAVITNLFVIFYEERALQEKFGAAYTDYCARVPRWIPSLRGSATNSAGRTSGAAGTR